MATADRTDGSNKGAKLRAFLAALKESPMRSQEARQLAGRASFHRLQQRGVIEVYIDENPDYAAGRRRAWPMVQWARLGDAPWPPLRSYPGDGRMSKLGRERRLQARIDRAIALLREHGFTVSEPPA